jgi:hypothetical protein
MHSLQQIDAEFETGLVSEAGFRWLADAEVYGDAASIGALERRLLMLHRTIVTGREITIHHPQTGHSIVRTEKEFSLWCKEYFPSASIGPGSA